jgi:DNA-binding MltR family transcriptional regulator
VHLAKKKRIDLQAYSSAADFPSIQSELVDASDRAAAIVGAAALDVHLERLLSAFMVDDMQEVNNLVASDNPGAPLGSFSARTRACYCLGLITRTAFDDLNRIRQIRNIFAHHVLE